MNTIEKLEKISNGDTSIEFTNQDTENLASDFAEIALQRYQNKMEFLGSSGFNTRTDREFGGLGSANYNPFLSKGILDAMYETGTPTQTKLSEWLANPRKFDRELKRASEHFYNVSMQYRRAVSHLSEILLYNYTLNPISKPADDSEGEKKKWKEAYYRDLAYLPKLNIKNQFPRKGKEAIKDGVGYYYYKETDDFATLIKLPSDYCIMTGVWDWGNLFVLDLTYFDKFGGMLKETCPEFAKQYDKFIKLREMDGVKEKDITKSRFYRFLPGEGLALTGDEFGLTPVLQGVFRDVLEIDVYKELTKSKTILDTFKLIMQEIPYDSDGDPYLSVAAATSAISRIKTILPKNVGIAATPLTKSTAIDFTNGAQSKDNIVGTGEQQFWRNVGTSGMIMDTAGNTSKIVEYGLINDYSFVEHIYRQIENFINLRLMMLAKENDSKYYNRIKLFGNRYTNDSDLKNYMALVQNLNMPIGKAFAYAGYEPHEVEPMIMMENEIGLKQTMTPVIPGAQQSGGPGRPEMDDSEITDAAEVTREQDSGEERRM